ncbi:endonuclease 2-like isoform X2 [Nymphaea colorata]|uniref:endonuclease 2-like isoform X2 n=1 Tax=Nymphaea colorata TaxID=210225 RepID=UPI00129D871C|nr:endonuclease 2-like isoform X2 [Nymphaea colorata]
MAENRESFLLLCSILFIIAPLAHGWGKDGHFIICRIAQARLSEKTAAAVNDLLPDYAQNDLASLCLWADHVKFRFPWSSPLHYIDTPDSLCTFAYKRDCKNEAGEADMCVAGGIKNYTRQLEAYSDSSLRSQYNLTQALLFLSHFVGDVHQPLHVGFTTDKGGNTIDVKWFTRKTVLHHVWDDSLIETAVERFYGSDVESLLDEIQSNITGAWAGRIDGWEKCSRGVTACPDGYASESITAACNFAYKDVDEDDYFLSRLPTVYLRLAEAGVRLAATLNRALG